MCVDILKNSDNANCELCNKSQNDPSVYNFLLKIVNNAKSYSNLINSFYEIPLTLSQTVFSFLKPFTTTREGTYAFDLNNMLLIKMKSLDIKKSKYYGIYYSTTPTLLLEYYFKEIINDYKKNNIEYASLIYGTGASPRKPEHWCGIFIDHLNREFFFYNSLAKQSQLDKKLFYFFANLNYSFITNNNKQQYDNNLCGIFACDFIIRMLINSTLNNDTDSKLNVITSNMEYFYNNIDINKNLDKYFEDNIQYNFISKILNGREQQQQERINFNNIGSRKNTSLLQNDYSFYLLKDFLNII